MAVVTSRGDLFGRSAPSLRGTHAAGMWSSSSAKRRQALYFFARRPTYIRTRAKMSSRDVAAPTLSCIHGGALVTWASVRTPLCEEEEAGAECGVPSLSRTLNQSDRFCIYGRS